MNKSILAIAVAATMAAPAAVMASAPTVYGNVHVSINDRDSQADIDMTSNTSAIGVKGSEDLGDGLKAIYKLEWQVDVADGGATDPGTSALVKRDQFVGLKGGLGTIKFGTFSSNYKQKGGKVDSLYRTPLEGRGGLMMTQSRLHNGRATNRGRLTNAIGYTSPKMGGISLDITTTVSNNTDETIGAGLRWSNKNIMLFVDWIDTVPGGASVSTAASESATKVGGKFKTKAFHIAAQFEQSEDVTGFDYAHLNAGFNINKNNSIQFTYGMASHINISAADTDSVALVYNHKLSKMTNVYLGYGDRSSDTAAAEDDMITAGIRKKF